jgi:phosphotransferase system enzyme I (PtsI)
VYHQVAQRFADKEVIIRTLDVGGDKAVPYLGLEREENPFLGFRAIRYCLERTDVFKTQLRAILRAGAAFPKVKLMLPLVTGLEELREAKKLVETCQQELEQEGVPYHKTIEVGVMIETPAASMISDLLAKEADFFSIGTNDLTQYTMAVDRGNSKVSGLYSPLHPAVVRSIRQVIANGKAAGIPVGMCGEAAGDERMIPLLLSFGLDEFSVGSSSVLQTRKRIAQWTMAQARAVADDAMTLGTAEEMAQRLEKRQ